MGPVGREPWLVEPVVRVDCGFVPSDAVEVGAVEVGAWLDRVAIYFRFHIVVALPALTQGLLAGKSWGAEVSSQVVNFLEVRTDQLILCVVWAVP